MIKIKFAAYQKIYENMKKYSLEDKIPIERAKYIISAVHRIPKPYSTMVINELSILGWIKLSNGSKYLELKK